MGFSHQFHHKGGFKGDKKGVASWHGFCYVFYAMHSLKPQPLNQKESLLQSLSTGDWLFSELLPEFRSALLEKCAGSKLKASENLSITYLAAAYYKNWTLPSEHKNRSCFVVGSDPRNLEANSFWNAAVREINRDAQLGSLDTEWLDCVSSALEIVKISAPKTFEALYTAIAYLCTLENAQFRSASLPHFFGTVFLSKVKDPKALAISLVHELAHQELFLLNLKDRLIHAELDFHLVHAPFQGMKRPPIGRLHSAHALFRMVEFEMAAKLGDPSRHRTLLAQTTSTFSKDELTSFARKIVYEIY